MKPNQTERVGAAGLVAADVEAYLRRHPDFFHHHLDLLGSLKIPHPCGEAVSLVAMQLEVLREKNRRLHAQMRELVQVARDNDGVSRRLHELTLALLDATSLDDALAGLKWSLHECFAADFVTLRVTEPLIETPVADLCEPIDSPRLSPIRSRLELGAPACGQPREDQVRCLFGQAAGEVLSYALIPLRHAALKGFLAIGSASPHRFQVGMGKLFLTQLGEIVAARLADLICRRGASEHGA